MADAFDEAMASFSPALPLAVAYSGGADSTALLLACADKWPGGVCAIHVHHGLQAADGRHGFALGTQVLVQLVELGRQGLDRPVDVGQAALAGHLLGQDGEVDPGCLNGQCVQVAQYRLAHDAAL